MVCVKIYYIQRKESFEENENENLYNWINSLGEYEKTNWQNTKITIYKEKDEKENKSKYFKIQLDQYAEKEFFTVKENEYLMEGDNNFDSIINKLKIFEPKLLITITGFIYDYGKKDF
jgi:hypothetical protein